jgi:hypothetical protein
MKATLKRTYDSKQTMGVLELDNGFECDTLELTWLKNTPQFSCIPEGTYTVVPRTSQKYGKHLHVTNVPNRNLILIHWGNYAGSVNPKTKQPDIKGCIMVGYGYSDITGDGIKEIVRSKAAFTALMIAAKDGFELTVTG